MNAESCHYSIALMEARTPMGLEPALLYQTDDFPGPIIITKTPCGRAKVVIHLPHIVKQSTYDLALSPLEGAVCRIAKLTRDGVDNFWCATSAQNAQWLIAARPPMETLALPAELHLYLLD